MGHRRREEESLPLLRDLLHDALDVLLEPDGEHLVSLVEDAVLDVAKVEGAALDEVDEAAGGADDDVHPAAERALLAGDGDASVDAEGAEGGHGGLNLLFHLVREFTSGREHDAARVPVFLLVVEEGLDDGEGEAEGLARAGSRAAHHVAALERGRQDLRLDGKQGFDAALLQGSLGEVGEGEVVDVHGVLGRLRGGDRVLLLVLLLGCILHLVEDAVDGDVLVHVVHLAEEVLDFFGVVLVLEDRNSGGVGGDGAEPEPGGSDIRGATRRRRGEGARARGAHGANAGGGDARAGRASGDDGGGRRADGEPAAQGVDEGHDGPNRWSNGWRETIGRLLSAFSETISALGDASRTRARERRVWSGAGLAHANDRLLRPR
mmetsp:Transcript_8526/g.38746  ORF Transcript_8526/g.38746 Transcript_8526/m.38746 type:complete len:378 (+) Transcript_8526:372-1505(+)